MKKSELRQMLRKAGYKATSPRLSVLDVMRKSKAPLSAQEIMEKLDKGTADKVTVYRTIKHLGSSGIIKQVDLRHNHAHYELVDRVDHHHIVCLRCSRIEDIQGCELGEMQSAVLRAAKHFFEISQHSLEFYGICKKCA